MTADEFAQAFTEALNQEDVRLSPDSVFREAVQWDSLCVLLTIAFADEAYGKEVSAKQIAGAQTVTDLWRLLEGTGG